jgi:hypothetical protein
MFDLCLEHCTDDGHKRFIEEKIPDWLTGITRQTLGFAASTCHRS